MVHCKRQSEAEYRILWLRSILVVSDFAVDCICEYLYRKYTQHFDIQYLFGSKYYDAGKTFSFVIISNVILLFFFSPLYMMYSDNIQSMFVILGIHVLVAIFVSASIQEFVTNPHYSGSHLIGALLGLSVTIFAFGLVVKSVDLNTSGIEKILLSMPAFCDI